MGTRSFMDLFKDAYFHGTQGVLAVFDVTRRDTLLALGTWISTILDTVGSIRVCALGNKIDLRGRRETTEADAAEVLRSYGCSIRYTSAKTGENVEEAFRELAEAIVGPGRYCPPACGPAQGHESPPRYHDRFRPDILYDASRVRWKPMSPNARARNSPQDSVGPDSVHVKAAAERLRTNPDDLDALVAVGAWFLARGQADKALECFHRITKADPTYPGIWRLKARAFEALGDHGNARICRRRGADPRS